MTITGSSISLRRLTLDDATNTYVEWLNSTLINQYTESKFMTHTIETTRDFIASVSNDSNYAFAIIDNESGKHIGNIKIGSIDRHHRNADIGLIIGNTDFWGKGIATQAMKMCVEFGFKQLKLHRLGAGVYKPNIGSSKALINAGFQLEGTKKEAAFFDGQWIDSNFYGIVNKNEECRKKLVLGTVQFGVDYGINSAGKPSHDMVTDILALASKDDVKLVDTSAAYGDSEYVLGKTIPPSGGQFKIVSKYPPCQQSVAKQLDQSLENLGQKSIYGYLLHHFEVYQQNGAIWREFQDAKTQGKVEKIGFSLYHPQELEEIFTRGDKFDLLQVRYNIFDRQFEPYFQKLKSKGVEIHVRSTFLQGLFFKNRNTLPENLLPLKKHLEQLDAYAHQCGITVAQVALNFNLQNPYIDGVLIGVDNVSQLRENINSIIDSKIDFRVNITEKHLLNPVNWR